MKRNVDYVLIVFGLILLAAGLYFVKTATDPRGLMLTLPYVCIGLGCGIFGHGAGSLISKQLVSSDPEQAKRLAVEMNDERNVAIGNMAKAKAYDMMIFVFGALQISFALMGADLAVILLLVAAYLFVVGYGIYYRMRYNKEM